MGKEAACSPRGHTESVMTEEACTAQSCVLMWTEPKAWAAPLVPWINPQTWGGWCFPDRTKGVFPISSSSRSLRCPTRCWGLLAPPQKAVGLWDQSRKCSNEAAMLLTAEVTSWKMRMQLQELFSAHWPWEPATMLGGSSDGPETTWSCSWAEESASQYQPWWVRGRSLGATAFYSLQLMLVEQRGCVPAKPHFIKYPGAKWNWWGNLSHCHGNRIKGWVPEPRETRGLSSWGEAAVSINAWLLCRN